ncbi:hypothetical protein GSI_09232 [Ganoderma sinense ZZ0214-1]|uniref:Uncharacterized protein n=1 Tax=Ganoderma sinense ZZ0214-1 TaxID=1077348 RepID=A0A2G8S5Z0_9APHY|nr:hypothetical protein GSI_09232 [Ganoderma sinense ZZ0214-1]
MNGREGDTGVSACAIKGDWGRKNAGVFVTSRRNPERWRGEEPMLDRLHGGRSRDLARTPAWAEPVSHGSWRRTALATGACGAAIGPRKPPPRAHEELHLGA